MLKPFNKFYIPKVIYLSHLYDENPDSSNWNDTKATWEESIAYIDNPLLDASRLTVFTRSLIASTIFFKTWPSANLASNI